MCYIYPRIFELKNRENKYFSSNCFPLKQFSRKDISIIQVEEHKAQLKTLNPDNTMKPPAISLQLIPSRLHLTFISASSHCHDIFLNSKTGLDHGICKQV